jgi:4-methyl-5(b-hydroxyethyl)-thiazole monophosphate biosynthesis
MMVVIPLANGFEEIEAVNLIDVLRRAEIEVVVAGVGAKMISGAHALKVETDRLISQVNSDDMEMIILPGGWDGTHTLADDTDVQRLLKEMDAKGKMIGAICAAPYALEKAGVLKHNYTCYPSVEKQIRLEGYSKEQAVVTDGNVMTSRGPGTAICFALAIVERLKGKETAIALKNGILADFC